MVVSPGSVGIIYFDVVGLVLTVIDTGLRVLGGSVVGSTSVVSAVPQANGRYKIKQRHNSMCRRSTVRFLSDFKMKCNHFGSF